MLAEGADPDSWDRWGRTPVVLAVDYNTLSSGDRSEGRSLDETTSLEMTYLLVEAEASPNMQLMYLLKPVH